MDLSLMTPLQKKYFDKYKGEPYGFSDHAAWQRALRVAAAQDVPAPVVKPLQEAEDPADGDDDSVRKYKKRGRPARRRRGSQE